MQSTNEKGKKKVEIVIMNACPQILHRIFHRDTDDRTMAILPFHTSAFFLNPNGDDPSLKFNIVLSLLVAVIVFVNFSTDLACAYAMGLDLMGDITLL